jgi:hypothetical protein
MKKLSSKLFLTTLLTLSITPSYAQSFSSDSGFKNLTIQPLVGYERVQKVTPTPRTKTRMFYGLRALYGVPHLSAELQVTRAKDDETLNNGDLRLKETATTGMLGIYSHFAHQSMLSVYLRAGGHARKSEIEKIEDGVSTTSDPAVRLSPYAGSGLIFKLAQYFSLTAGVTVIFTGEPQGSDREYQTDLGFNIHF